MAQEEAARRPLSSNCGNTCLKPDGHGRRKKNLKGKRKEVSRRVMAEAVQEKRKKTRARRRWRRWLKNWRKKKNKKQKERRHSPKKKKKKKFL